MPLAEYLATGPAHERPVLEAVLAHLDTVGPVHIEPVSVGILLKTTRTFAQLRPMTRWEALSFSLTRPVRHPRMGRKVEPWRGRYHHVFNLRAPADFDARIREWLTESYLLDAEGEGS
jgi:hypothetical protein